MTFRPVRTIYAYNSASTAPLNMALPWQNSTSDGLFLMNRSSEDAERDNLLFWAQTNWGEIPYKFRFGLDVRRHLFDNTSDLRQSILRTGKAQLSRYFAHLKILDFKVFTSEDDSNLSPNEIRIYLRAETNKGKQIEIQEIVGN